MRSTKPKIPSFAQLYDRAESWCMAPNDSSKSSARYFFAWATGLTFAGILIALYVIAWINSPLVGSIITVGVIVPFVLYWLGKWIKWVFSD